MKELGLLLGVGSRAGLQVAVNRKGILSKRNGHTFIIKLIRISRPAAVCEPPLRNTDADSLLNTFL
jgi:hypothetical protein